MELLVLTSEAEADEVLGSLALLAHPFRLAAPTASSLVNLDDVDVVIVDARSQLAGARTLCRLLHAMAESIGVIAVVPEASLVALNEEWCVDDFFLPSAGPAETDARLRLVLARKDAIGRTDETAPLTVGELVIDEETYVARLRGEPLDLTYKEFELLKYLMQHLGRVFTRSQLLQEVWGYDFFGGTRTVDVHVRRLRAKLGADHEALIGTVRNVGYKAVSPGARRSEEGSNGQ